MPLNKTTFPLINLNMKNFTLTVAILLGIITGTLAQTTVYTYDFTSASLPAGWTNVDNTGNNPTAGIWKRSTNSAFAGPTAATGFMWLLSDAQNNDNLVENATLTMEPVNCVANTKVFLQFNQSFNTYFDPNTNSQGKIEVSNNGSNWNEVYTISTNTDNPELVTVDISSFAAGQASVLIRFNFTGNWDGYWAIDDIKVIEPPVLDAAVVAVDLPKYIGTSSQTISGTVQNMGSTPITSVQLSYSINGGTPVSQTFNGWLIDPFQTQNFSFSTPASFNTVQTYDVTVTAVSPNGGSDAVSGNNTGTATSVVLSAFPIKNVLLEEFTTAPCQYCPGGSTRVEYILENNERVHAVGIHSGFGTDAMTTADHSTLASNYTTSAPALMIDRVYYEAEEGNNVGLYNFPYDRWEPYAQARRDEITPVSVAGSSTYNSGTRELNVDVTATFYGVINEGFRVNCYIVEDSVSGTGSGYNQVNAYNTDQSSKTGNGTAGAYTITVNNNTDLEPRMRVSGTGIGTGAVVTHIVGNTVTLSVANTAAVSGSVTFKNEWFGAGSTIVGYKHRHVARYMFGGAWGTTGTIPTTTADGVAYTKQYTYTLPAGWNDQRIKLIALVQHFNAADKYDREIMNAIEFGLNDADSTGVNQPSAIAQIAPSINAIRLYPNPAQNFVSVEYAIGRETNFSIDVTNIVGQSVTTFAAATLTEGSYKTQINTADYSNGIYFVTLRENGKPVQTIKFIVSK